MARAKVAITLDKELLLTLDNLVKNNVFSNRSQAINEALNDKIIKIKKNRLKNECIKLNRKDEIGMADFGLLQGSKEWPIY